MGLLFCFLIGREALRLAETYSWAERRCEILHSQVVRSGGENPYRPELRFRSADAGAPLSGHQIQRRDLAYDSHGAVAARITPYPVGASVPCYASAQGEAVLERGPCGSASGCCCPGSSSPSAAWDSWRPGAPPAGTVWGSPFSRRSARARPRAVPVGLSGASASSSPPSAA